MLLKMNVILIIQNCHFPSKRLLRIDVNRKNKEIYKFENKFWISRKTPLIFFVIVYHSGKALFPCSFLDKIDNYNLSNNAVPNSNAYVVVVMKTVQLALHLL